MQSLLWLPKFTEKPVFVPELFVQIRKRLDHEFFNLLTLLLSEADGSKPKKVHTDEDGNDHGRRQHRERLHLRRPSQLGRLQRIVRPRHAIGTLSKALRHAATGSPSGQALPREGEQESYQDKKRAIGERNEVEATFGTSKRVCRANDIRAKLDDTADTWIGACFFAKNVMKFLKGLLCLIFAKLGLKAFKRRISYSIDYLMGILDPTRGCLVKIIE